ncbi:hypothetical protein LX32DRAFT_204236 [Colletotrichum zoysiae]|uniref:Uncharacterized protein n=1 Tax=Colletotrichum zoysiae TaxID=1216348 RepID=A0AAD9H6E4_9PEZI|nr:hypothetical protein LX32DRAFT_204236 [Colletotrichum zoysiae]
MVTEQCADITDSLTPTCRMSMPLPHDIHDHVARGAKARRPSQPVLPAHARNGQSLRTRSPSRRMEEQQAARKPTNWSPAPFTDFVSLSLSLQMYEAAQPPSPGTCMTDLHQNHPPLFRQLTRLLRLPTFPEATFCQDVNGVLVTSGDFSLFSFFFLPFPFTLK